MTHNDFSLIGAIPGQYLTLHSCKMGTSIIRYLGHDKQNIHASWSVNLGSNYTSNNSSHPLVNIDNITIIPGA